MSKINILPPSVYNRIAAGEVVERPYSVVKELVENAIDAGATEIEIYIEQGGKQLVRVVDKGSGIERDDLHSAFLPHATSKLQTAEDLRNILTLGFRGEAVASIASVSKMTITSKTENGKCYRLSSDGGVMSEITEAAGDKGTDVAVEMLFFNIPARLAFLKSDKAEEADITTVVSRFILSNADIAFTYYVNGKRMLQSFGGGEDEAIAGVYGASVLAQCYKIDAERNGVKIRGYIGNQNFYKANKSYQSVFLNGRYILNNTITSAVSGAYASYLMKRQYPFYVLHIDVPTECVDVNVHPNKADVRFLDNRVIYGAVYTVVSSVLDGNAKALDYVVEETTQNHSPIEDRPLSKIEPQAEKTLTEKILGYGKDSGVDFSKYATSKETENAEATNNIFPYPTMTYEEAKKEIAETQARVEAYEKQVRDIYEEARRDPGFIPIETIPDYSGKLITQSPFLEDPAVAKKRKKNPEKLQKLLPHIHFERTYLCVNDPAEEQMDAGDWKQDQVKEEKVDYFEENKRYLEELEQQNKQNKIEVKSAQYAGKLFNTYILYEREEEVYIIDQHAAHERLIFNRLKEQMQTRSIAKQTMLLPFEMQVNAFEATFLREHLKDIREIGFDIEDAGNGSFKVTAVPLDLQKMNIGSFFHEILGDVSGYRAIKLDELLKDKLASAACKAAVKGGMDLTEEEIQTLFTLMDGDMGLKCPHGRPVVVKMTRKQLEKMFKRIV